MAKHLAKTPAPENTVIHYCIYHGQFPLLQRSCIETMLDKALSRHDESHWQLESGIPEVISPYSQAQHIFVVLATSVAEVGRDHDYDWAVVEPSSMRSIIQLAGRIQRHRKQAPEVENIHILSHNFKGLKGLSPCFEKPGFESEDLQCWSRNLEKLVDASELDGINAIARIKTPSFSLTNDRPRRFKSFNGLEHLSQQLRLQGSPKVKNYVALWWNQDVTWCAEIQRLQPFRQSAANEDYRLVFSRTDKLIWQKKLTRTYPVRYQNTSDMVRTPEKVVLAAGVQWWGEFDLTTQVSQLVEKLNRNEEQIMKIFTHVSLRKLPQDRDQQWQCHPVMGIYQILKKDEYSDDK